MPIVVMEFAIVYLNIMVIHIENVGRSACRILIVHSIELARIISAWIPASEFAARMRNARLSIMYPLVAVSRIMKAIHSLSVNVCNVSLPIFVYSLRNSVIEKSINFTTLHLDSTHQTLRALPLRT